MGINYLEAAKNQILAIEGEHPVEEVQVRALTAIADVLIHTAMKDERTCEWCADGKFDGQVVMMSNHGWQRINYCPNCGRKVVK